MFYSQVFVSWNDLSYPQNLWKTLWRNGSYACLITVFIVVLAIGAFLDRKNNPLKIITLRNMTTVSLVLCFY